MYSTQLLSPIFHEKLLCTVREILECQEGAFAGRGETDKTAHTRKQLDALAASATACDHRLQEERFRQKADANSGLEPQKHCGTRFSTYATGIA